MYRLPILALLALAGCTTYRPATPFPPTPNVQVARRVCAEETARAYSTPFSLAGGLIAAPSAIAYGEDCMIRHGWIAN